jgi:hypothetical protein
VPNTKGEQVSLVELKRLALRLLPQESTLRKAILSEPDTLPKWSALAKFEVYLTLQYEELRRR